MFPSHNSSGVSAPRDRNIFFLPARLRPGADDTPNLRSEEGKKRMLIGGAAVLLTVMYVASRTDAGVPAAGDGNTAAGQQAVAHPTVAPKTGIPIVAAPVAFVGGGDAPPPVGATGSTAGSSAAASFAAGADATSNAIAGSAAASSAAVADATSNAISSAAGGLPTPPDAAAASTLVAGSGSGVSTATVGKDNGNTAAAVVPAAAGTSSSGGSDAAVAAQVGQDNGNTGTGGGYVPDKGIAALLNLKKVMGGSEWQRGGSTMTGWENGIDPCTWPGVRCAADEHTITGLFLSRCGLVGSIPETGVWENLPHLEDLHMASNSLKGSIPSSLGNLTKLKTLMLENNELTGTIPAELAALTELEGLWMEKNHLRGKIPPEVTGHWAKLQRIYLDGNHLTGSIPENVGNMAMLQFIHLGGNFLRGPIPDTFGDCTKLRILELEHNHLSSTIPERLTSLSELEFLMLEDNKLTGSIPEDFGKLTNLKLLGINRNHLVGSVPDQVCKNKVNEVFAIMSGMTVDKFKEEMNKKNPRCDFVTCPIDFHMADGNRTKIYKADSPCFTCPKGEHAPYLGMDHCLPKVTGRPDDEYVVERVANGIPPIITAAIGGLLGVFFYRKFGGRLEGRLHGGRGRDPNEAELGNLQQGPLPSGGISQSGNPSNWMSAWANTGNEEGRDLLRGPTDF
eukprot:CAMPEP_0194284838 /NCGR_PEP_ID=MMETSP0169-20130528/28673_1 /TAXON_ID=218684 /ORGANISM="Corethron pennatum, Strain L29A3" /LENGTH=678 /DNA_ID=CAMNT_0039030777 /DNA_START=105 /DNA_END=2141 /DNA_ORIENTATION=-